MQLSSLKPLRLSFNVTSPYILMYNCYSVNLEPNDPMLSYSHAHRLIISFFHKGSNCVLEVVWIYKGKQKKWFEIITTNGHTWQTYLELVQRTQYRRYLRSRSNTV